MKARKKTLPPRSKVTTNVISQPKVVPIRVRWEGAQFVWHSLAHVNRELCLQLLASGQIEMSLLPTEAHQFGVEEDIRFAPLAERFFAPLSGTAEVHVRHIFPPRFVPPPDEGHFVLIQPWEFGTLPKDWIGPLCEQVSEIWCHTQYVHEVYRASGIPEDRLHLLPHGVDTNVFHPDALPYIFSDEPGADRLAQGKNRPFLFLFVGGTLHRKGIDILLDAYLRAFSALDDVCLVIKDTGTQTVYQGMNWRSHILERVADKTRPRILYLEEDLSAFQMAGLYATCDCLVQPYRGEGFCLPALEAMACGCPVIVPLGGATDDFVDEAVGWCLPAERRPLNTNWVGQWECVEKPWLLEVDPEDLARLLRKVVGDHAERKNRGLAAAQRVQQEWTWAQAATRALQRLQVLREQPTSHRTWSPIGVPVPEPAVHTTPRDASQPPESQGSEASLLPFERSGPTLSLCMIVRDEERVLADCLQSVQPWMDEIIVVDTGSVDRTVEIAQGFGAQVFTFPWCDDFSAARNESLRHATGDWIFWLDADDTLPSRSGEAIRAAIRHAPDEIVGFVIPVQFIEDNGQEAGTRVDHVKLFRNLPGLQFEGRIHEQVLPTLRATGKQIARCDAVVLHSGYDTSPEGQAKKRDRDNRLLQLDLQERPDHPFVLFNLGMTDHYGGKHEQAVFWLRRCLAVSAPTDSIVRKAYALLVVSLRELGQMEECLRTLEAGLALVPNDPELHFHAGFLLTGQGRMEEAKRHYLYTLEADISEHFSSVDMGILGYKTYHNLGSLCRQMGHYIETRTWLLKAIEAAPQFTPSIMELFHAALEVQDFPTAEQMLQHILRLEGPSETWATLGVLYSEATGGHATTESFLNNAVARDPNGIGPRLAQARWLLQTEREVEAQEHLEILSRQGVAEAAFYLGVSATRQGDYRVALPWMERALALNPAHAETQEQVINLRNILHQIE